MTGTQQYAVLDLPLFCVSAQLTSITISPLSSPYFRAHCTSDYCFLNSALSFVSFLPSSSPATEDNFHLSGWSSAILDRPSSYQSRTSSRSDIQNSSHTGPCFSGVRWPSEILRSTFVTSYCQHTGTCQRA